ncbi:MAG: preprotein translocase subunit SecD [Salinirussus sp.]
MIDLRENWRIVLLGVLVLVSGIVLFAPSGGGESSGTNATAAAAGPTNLQYGLELSGGTRLRAELVGLTAEGVGITADNVNRVQRTVYTELGVDPIDVEVRRTTESTGTVEVFSRSVTPEEFVSALREAGLDASVDDVREGVTAETRERASRVIDRRINRGGLSGGSSSVVGTGTGEFFIVVEVPNANRSEVLDLIGSPGRVQIVAGFPTEGSNGTTQREVSLLTQGDFRGIGQAQQGQGNRPPFVRVTLTEQAARNFTNAMQNFGFTGEGVGACRYNQTPEDPGYCLYTVVDGRITYAASMGSGLAELLRPGGDGTADFVSSPTFRMQTGNLSTAQELQLNLESGALPTELNVQSELFLAPSLAQKFKPLALLTGLVAWLAVSGAVFFRYREPKVAVPMLVTAAAEVFLLLGFAAAVGLPLNLSHIAGFIAVIGTGVDDLVIIADEILQRGEITTGRVFQSRFRKAFWVIGAAAATTIIAMSPLAILSLGDLQGFAIVTIVGVLIGVLVTRPAYGDVLRNLLLED